MSIISRILFLCSPDNYEFVACRFLKTIFSDQRFIQPSKEDKRNRNLLYACRLCRYTEPAPDQPLIYRFDLKKEVGNILHTVPSAVSDDPTLARSQNANCANCGHNEAVFFMSDSTQSDSLALIFVCCNCDYKWVN